jgi:hypothetical protein
LVAVVCLQFPTSAVAQPPDAFAQLSTTLGRNQRVLVQDTAGGKTRGQITDVAPDFIRLRVSDGLGNVRLRTFRNIDVATIRRSDRLWNGLLIGTAAGFAATEIWVYRLCGPRGYDTECAAIALGVGWVSFVPAGAVVGALIDKAIGNQLIYRAGPKAASVRIVPRLMPGRQAVTTTITF